MLVKIFLTQTNIYIKSCERMFFVDFRHSSIHNVNKWFLTGCISVV